MAFDQRPVSPREYLARQIMRGNINFNNLAIKVWLSTGTFIPDTGVSMEYTGIGYTAGGLAVTHTFTSRTLIVDEAVWPVLGDSGDTVKIITIIIQDSLTGINLGALQFIGGGDFIPTGGKLTIALHTSNGYTLVL